MAAMGEGTMRTEKPKRLKIKILIQELESSRLVPGHTICLSVWETSSKEVAGIIRRALGMAQ